MGFLDKLKDVAKGAAEQLAKANEEREKQKLLDSLDDCGSVKGKNIPENAWLCLDRENKRIVLRTSIINNHHNLICEYSFDDVVAFELTKCSESQFKDYTSTFSYLKVTLNSGEELDVCNIVNKCDSADASEYNKKREAESNERVLDIIVAFADKAKDNETIKWANNFLEANGFTDRLEYFQ